MARFPNTGYSITPPRPIKPPNKYTPLKLTKRPNKYTPPKPKPKPKQYSQTDPNYYEILGIRENSTQHQIRQAYYACESELKNVDTWRRTERWNHLNRLVPKAYEILSDEKGRRKYDKRNGLGRAREERKKEEEAEEQRRRERIEKKHKEWRKRQEKEKKQLEEKEALNRRVEEWLLGVEIARAEFEEGEKEAERSGSKLLVDWFWLEYDENLKYWRDRHMAIRDRERARRVFGYEYGWGESYLPGWMRRFVLGVKIGVKDVWWMGNAPGMRAMSGC